MGRYRGDIALALAPLAPRAPPPLGTLLVRVRARDRARVRVRATGRARVESRRVPPLAASAASHSASRDRDSSHPCT